MDLGISVLTEVKTAACLPVLGPNLLFLGIRLERGSLPGAAALPYRLHSSQNWRRDHQLFLFWVIWVLGVRIEEGEELVGSAKYKSMKVCVLHY